MSDRTRNDKTRLQDAVGFVLILLGGFGAVSIVLFLRGQQPAENAMRGATWPVVELVTLLGSASALIFSAGLAGLGVLLFLRTTVLAPARPALALATLALGFALILGAVESGGEVGAWLPGLLAGFAGRALSAVLGLALAWLGWTLLVSTRPPRASSAETVQRLGLAGRHDVAAGVSPAEAALLVTEPRALAPLPGARREETKAIRVETVRPFAPAKEAPAAGPRAKSETMAASLVTRVRPPVAAAEPPTPLSVAERGDATPVPPAPSWESTRDGADEELSEEPERLQLADLAPEPDEFDEFEDVAAEEDEEAEDQEVRGAPTLLATEEEDRGGEPSVPALGTPRASWEQVGLFDDQEEEEEEEAAETGSRGSLKAELTPSFDFDSAEPKSLVHEPEHGEDPFATQPALVESAELLRELREQDTEEEVQAAEAEQDEEQPVELAPARALAAKPRRSAPPAPVAVPVPQPVKPAPVREHVERESTSNTDEEKPWEQLVFEAGLAILEQKRVAVSMLERRFGIDFDQACRVLDELQQAGLIGPYMGGRTRDILLTREEWLAHVPHAS